MSSTLSDADWLEVMAIDSAQNHSSGTARSSMLRPDFGEPLDHQVILDLVRILAR